MSNPFARSESSHSLTLNDRNKLEVLKQNCPIPKCEAKRLQVLRETSLLGSVDDTELYERNVSLVSRLFKVSPFVGNEMLGRAFRSNRFAHVLFSGAGCVDFTH